MPVDYFRRVPRDFTESSAAGTILSIIATAVMGALFVLEFRAYLTASVVTDVIMDDARDGEDIQINFDLSMPDLVCQYASIDVSDMMGTNRQGITKNIVMRRVDSQGNFITNVDYTGDQVLEYEEFTGDIALDCRATMYENNDFSGWQVDVSTGRHPVGELEKISGWENDAVGSITVDEGCVAIAYEHGDFAGWHAILEPGKHNGTMLEAAGGKTDDISSLVLVAGTKEDATAAHNAIEEDHANMIKREAHELTEATR